MQSIKRERLLNKNFTDIMIISLYMFYSVITNMYLSWIHANRYINLRLYMPNTQCFDRMPSQRTIWDSLHYELIILTSVPLFASKHEPVLSELSNRLSGKGEINHR